MPNHRIFILFSGLLFLVTISHPHRLLDNEPMLHYQAYQQRIYAQTNPTPTSTPILTPTPLLVTPTADLAKPRITESTIPLICGAGILVLIIVGAILFVPRPPNHAGK